MGQVSTELLKHSIFNLLWYSQYNSYKMNTFARGEKKCNRCAIVFAALMNLQRKWIKHFANKRQKINWKCVATGSEERMNQQSIQLQTQKSHSTSISFLINLVNSRYIELWIHDFSSTISVYSNSITYIAGASVIHQILYLVWKIRFVSRAHKLVMRRLSS